MVNLPSEPTDIIATELLRKLQDVEAQLEQLKIIEERRHVDVLRRLDEATGVLEVVRVATAAALVADTPSTTEDGARTPSVTVSDESENDRSTVGESRRDSTCDTEIDAISRDVTDMNINAETNARNSLPSVNRNGVVPESDIFEPSAVANEDLLVGVSFGDDWETEEEETEEEANRDETEEGGDDVDGVDDSQSHTIIQDIKAHNREDGQAVSQHTEGDADQPQVIYEVVGMGENGGFESHITGSQTESIRKNEKVPREPKEEQAENWKVHLEDPGPEYLGNIHDLRTINEALEALDDNKDIMEAITANSEIDSEEKDDEEELHAINEALDALKIISSALSAENSDIEENDEGISGTINERLDVQGKDGLGPFSEDAAAGSPSEADINSDNGLVEDREVDGHTIREIIEVQRPANMIELVEDQKSKSDLTSSAPNTCLDSTDRYSSSSEEGYHSERFEEGFSRLDPEALMTSAFPKNPRFVYRVQTRSAGTQVPVFCNCAYHASGFSSHFDEPPTLESGSKYNFPESMIESAYQHSLWNPNELSPFVSTTNDLLRAFTIAVANDSETDRISVIDLNALPPDRYWCMRTVLSDYEKRPEPVDGNEHAKLPIPERTGLERVRNKVHRRAKMTLTEYIIWQFVPESAVVAHWDWNDIKKSSSLVLPSALDVQISSGAPAPPHIRINNTETNQNSSVPVFFRYTAVSNLRRAIILREALTPPLRPLEQHISAWLAELCGDFNLDIFSTDSRFEFLLHFACMLIGFHNGLGAEERSDHRHRWPTGLDTNVMRLLVDAVELERLETKRCRECVQAMKMQREPVMPIGLIDQAMELASKLENISLE